MTIEIKSAEDPLTLEEITSWFRSKASSARDFGVILAEIRENQIHLPSAGADFDAPKTMGRISAWVSGEIDFEVLRSTDAEMVFFRHESVSGMDEPVLEAAFTEFLQRMKNP